MPRAKSLGNQDVKWLPDDLAPRWVFEVPDGIESGAAIVDGTVYVGGLDGVLYAIELATGKSRWTYPTGAAIRSSPSVGPDGAPATASANSCRWAAVIGP